MGSDCVRIAFGAGFGFVWRLFARAERLATVVSAGAGYCSRAGFARLLVWGAGDMLSGAGRLVITRRSRSFTSSVSGDTVESSLPASFLLRFLLEALL